MKLELYIIVSMEGGCAATRPREFSAPRLEVALHFPHVSGQICASDASCSPFASKTVAVLFSSSRSCNNDGGVAMSEPEVDSAVDNEKEHIDELEHCLTAAMSGCRTVTSCDGVVSQSKIESKLCCSIPNRVNNWTMAVNGVSIFPIRVCAIWHGV